MSNNEIIFGDKSTFAIRYVSGYYYKSKPEWLYAHLHLILGNNVIGDLEESCATEKSWIGGLKFLKDDLINKVENFKRPEFQNLSIDELFEIVDKANQFESDYKEEFKHLPVLSESVWDTCCINLDETMDEYLMMLVQVDDDLIFIWEKQKGKRNSVKVNKEIVLQTIKECIEYVENDYKNYQPIE